MSESIKNIVLVSASPKVDQEWAVSSFIAKRSELLLKDESLNVETIFVRNALLHHKTEQAFETLQSADAIVLIFPLYIFCMPAMLTRFLQDFVVKYPLADRVSRIYAIINCGFPESDINMEAMRVVECFAKQTKREFLGGVMIGGGGMVLAAKDAPFMRPIFALIDEMFARVVHDVCFDKPEPALITEASPNFPKWLYFIGGNSGWKSMARKNKLRSKDLYRRPYQR